MSWLFPGNGGGENKGSSMKDCATSTISTRNARGGQEERLPFYPNRNGVKENKYSLVKDGLSYCCSPWEGKGSPWGKIRDRGGGGELRGKNRQASFFFGLSREKGGKKQRKRPS